MYVRPSLDEIFDLQWSPDSTYVLAGAINSKVRKSMICHESHS
jgi:hypothetical protein